MRYRYAGPVPQDDGQGGVARPGEERDFDSEPDWGPWEPVPEDGAVSDSAPPGVVPPAPPPASPPAASPAPPGGTSAPAPFGTETSPGGM